MHVGSPDVAVGCQSGGASCSRAVPIQLVQYVKKHPNILQTCIQPLTIERLYGMGGITDNYYIRAVVLLRAFDTHYGHMRVGDKLGVQ